MKLSEIVKIVQDLAPPDLAQAWDNPGLQLGDPDAEIRKIAVALDAARETVEEAVARGAQLLLTHHPLLFKPLKRLDLKDGSAALIARAIKADLAIVSAHTNWDSAAQGVADALADLLELDDKRPLEAQTRGFLKLVVFVPREHERPLLEALFEAGAGRIGAYERCRFSAPGLGGFKAPEDAKPFIGRPGEETSADENRLEVILPKNKRAAVSAAVFRHHPYEEPAFEFHQVEAPGRGQGLGLLGRWNPARDLYAECREKLGLTIVKTAGPRREKISRVALLPGSGGSYADLAAAMGAEALITGDAGYHHAQRAEELGLTLIDAGHYETEWPGVVRLTELMSARLGGRAVCELLPQNNFWRFL